MCWNLAFHHLCTVVLAKHLVAFNQQWPITLSNHHTKAKIKAIAKMDDFSELKESEVLQICRSAGILSVNTYNVMKEKLEKRNAAAHPSDVEITQAQAEVYIDDLIRNAALKIS